MKREEINQAEFECKRFLKRLHELREAQQGPYPGTMPKEAGALRRASMDLTRALAKMRQSKGWEGGKP